MPLCKQLVACQMFNNLKAREKTSNLLPVLMCSSVCAAVRLFNSIFMQENPLIRCQSSALMALQAFFCSLNVFWQSMSECAEIGICKIHFVSMLTFSCNY